MILARSRVWFALSLALALGDVQAAQDPVAVPVNAVAVLYPEAGESFRGVFSKIIEGIAEATGGRTRSYAVGANVDVGDLNAQLKRNDTKVVIALGRLGIKAASGLDRNIPVVVGAVVMLSEMENRTFTGINLSPDPSLLFAKLTALQPGVKRVFVIYDPRRNEGLISLAREAAKAYRLELVAQEATDLAAAAKLYQAVFASADPRKDAIWLPLDSTTVEESVILPLVLKASWERNMTVFSSSLLHVRKGALFALYPNNLELGRGLAHTALRILAGEPKRGIAPLRAVETAVNLRTASHLGLNLSYQQRIADLVFPESQ